MLGILYCCLTSKSGPEQAFLKLCEKRDVFSVVMVRTLKFRHHDYFMELGLSVIFPKDIAISYSVFTLFAAPVGVALNL